MGSIGAETATELKSEHSGVVLRMKSSNLLKGVALILVSATGLAAVAFGDPPNAQFGNKYVFVTGSLIPLELWEWFHRPNWGKAAVVIANSERCGSLRRG